MRGVIRRGRVHGDEPHALLQQPQRGIFGEKRILVIELHMAKILGPTGAQNQARRYFLAQSLLEVRNVDLLQWPAAGEVRNGGRANQHV